MYSLIYFYIIPIKFVSDAFQARTHHTHSNHCLNLGGPLHNHYSTTYGLHRDSSLNTLKRFHVTQGLIPDIMHDCLEGCVQYEVKELFKYLSSQGILSIPAINNHFVQSFPFVGPDAVNWPALITVASTTSSDHSLKQTGNLIYAMCMRYVYFVWFWYYTSVSNQLSTMFCFTGTSPLTKHCWISLTHQSVGHHFPL